jgi:pilus assembly protein CpaF
MALPSVADAGLLDRVRRRLAVEPTPLEEVVRVESGGIVDDAVLAALRTDVAAELHGAGPLEGLLAQPGVTDVLVNAPDEVWLDRGRGLERAPVRFGDEAAVRRLAQRLVAAAGGRLDDAMPFADAVLPDGTRLHAMLPPLTRHTAVSLRVLARRPYDFATLVARGAVPEAVARLLRAVVSARLAFVVSGGTGCGKTTLLGALLGLAAPTERIVVIEDAPELVVAHPHVVQLSTRAANVEGAGAIGQRELVRQALRMRPDRLVVGEFRGAEMVELVVALNTGHDGSGATLHANSAADVPSRFLALGALAGLPAGAVACLVGSAIDVVVHLRRGPDGRRSIAELALLRRHGDELNVSGVWSERAGPLPGWEVLRALLLERGVTL